MFFVVGISLQSNYFLNSPGARTLENGTAIFYVQRSVQTLYCMETGVVKWLSNVRRPKNWEYLIPVVFYSGPRVCFCRSSDGSPPAEEDKVAQAGEFNSNNSVASDASADAAGGSRASGSGGSGGIKTRARVKAASVAPTPTNTPGETPFFRDESQEATADNEEGGCAAAGGTSSRPAAGLWRSPSSGDEISLPVAIPEVKMPERSAPAAAAPAAARSGTNVRRSSGNMAKGLRFSSRGRAITRQAATRIRTPAAETIIEESSSSTAGSPPPPSYEDMGESGPAAAAAAAAAVAVPTEWRKKALAAGAAAAAAGPAGRASAAETPPPSSFPVEFPVSVADSLASSGSGMPAPALKTSGSFRSAGERRTVSFADHGSSSELDYRSGHEEARPGVARGGTASTLRQVCCFGGGLEGQGTKACGSCMLLYLKAGIDRCGCVVICWRGTA